MTRTSVALFLALAVGLLEVGTGRPLAAQQSGRAQGAGAQQTGAPPATPPAPAPQGDAAQAPQPTFRAGINFVRVDAIVNDNKGAPVTDLTVADFEVLEDGKPQAIEQFRLIRVDGNPRPGEPPPRELRNRIDEEIEISRDDVRLFVFFFDDYHVRLGNSLSVKEPLTRFIQTQIRPNDIVGMMYPLTPVDGISFTRNPASIISAIERFEGRKFDYRPRNMFEEQYARAPSEIVEQIRNQVVMTALRGLATRLGGLREGRKAIIYVSEGFTAMLPPQMRNADASLGPLGNPGGGGRASPMTGENNPREETASFFAQSDLYSQLRDVFTAANRNNAAIYAVDPRGLTPFEYGIDEAVGPNQDRRALQMTQDSLRSLAEETDGRAIVNRNDLGPGLAQIVRDSSFYYLMGYNSTQAPADGKFHQITVRLKRRGLDVRARKGYWALTTEMITRANTVVPDTPKPVQQALASIAPSVQAGKYVRTWLGTARGEQGKTRVTLIWEPLPVSPGARRDQPLPGRVSLIAASAKGDLVFRGRVPDAAPGLSAAQPATGARPAGSVQAPVGGRESSATSATPASPGPQRLVFDAPPGELELRISVEATGGGMIDSEIRTITVPDLTTPDAAISTPRVHRSRTARDFQAIAADAGAVPAVGREFSRTERLLIRFDVYGNATPTAALLNRGGQKMADVPVVAAVAGGTHQIDLGLSAIAAGEYLVEITTKGATGEVKELIPLRVGS
ncbi:MAG: VWA domain-containing protein [Acidobacteria bacterium]|nr:VWA domain-containing protein [Acidobacteriota bacterium]